MSADNWGRCPACAARRGKTLADATAQIHKELERYYGKVTSEEYERRRQAGVAALEAVLKRHDDADNENTLRENYLFHMDESGEFFAKYRARCTADGCGFSFAFDHKEQVKV